jgi:hypothetical protein
MPTGIRDTEGGARHESSTYCHIGAGGSRADGGQRLWRRRSAGRGLRRQRGLRRHADKGSIVVGGQDFTEMQIMASIYELMLTDAGL